MRTLGSSLRFGFSISSSTMTVAIVTARHGGRASSPLVCVL
jgi:hypothetical protein